MSPFFGLPALRYAFILAVDNTPVPYANLEGVGVGLSEYSALYTMFLMWLCDRAAPQTCRTLGASRCWYMLESFFQVYLRTPMVFEQDLG